MFNKEQYKEWYNKNRKSVLKKQRNYWKKYYKKNKDIISIKKKEYRRNNKEQYKEWYNKNKDILLDRQRKYREKCKLKSINRKERIRNIFKNYLKILKLKESIQTDIKKEKYIKYYDRKFCNERQLEIFDELLETEGKDNILKKYLDILKSEEITVTTQ